MLFRSLTGWVNLQSESHVGLLVLNTFNISVPRGKIPQEWRWCERRVGFVGRKVRKVVQSWDGSDGIEEEVPLEQEEEDSGGWMDEDGKYVDGLLGFTVESVKASGHIITIEGNLLQNESDVGQANSVGHVQAIDIALRSVPRPVPPPPIPPPPVRGGKDGDTDLEEMLDRLQNVEGKERDRKKEKKDRGERKGGGREGEK